MDNNIIIFLPNYLQVNFIKWKNNYYIYIYNFFFFFLKTYICFFNKYLNYILINNLKIYFSLFKNLFFSWEYFFILKYNIFGKGFKLKKYNKNSMWKFNKAHFKSLFLSNIVLQKIHKTRFFLFLKNSKNKYLLTFFQTIYKKNIFLKKGIKLNRSFLILKKKKT